MASPKNANRNLNAMDDITATLRRGDSPPFTTTKGVTIYQGRKPIVPGAVKGSKTTGIGPISPGSPQFLL